MKHHGFKSLRCPLIYLSGPQSATTLAHPHSMDSVGAVGLLIGALRGYSPRSQCGCSWHPHRFALDNRAQLWLAGFTQYAACDVTCTHRSCCDCKYQPIVSLHLRLQPSAPEAKSSTFILHLHLLTALKHPQHKHRRAVAWISTHQALQATCLAHRTRQQWLLHCRCLCSGRQRHPAPVQHDNHWAAYQHVAGLPSGPALPGVLPVPRRGWYGSQESPCCKSSQHARCTPLRCLSFNGLLSTVRYMLGRTNGDLSGSAPPDLAFH
jgi:hypothetical protein